MLKKLKKWSQSTFAFFALGSWNLVSAIISFFQKNQNITVIGQLSQQSSSKIVDQTAIDKLYQITIMQDKFSLINLILGFCLYSILILKIVKTYKKSPVGQVYEFLSKKLT